MNFQIFERESDEIFVSTTAHRTLESAKNRSVNTDDAVIPTGTLAFVVAFRSIARSLDLQADVTTNKALLTL